MNAAKKPFFDKRSAFNLSLLIFLLFVYAVSFYLTPSPDGVGTHKNLFLPPCLFYETTGIPCPFCGATTSFACLAKGRIVEGFKANPFAFLLFFSGFYFLLYSGYCFILSKPFDYMYFFNMAVHFKWLVAACIIISWIIKVYCYLN
ncbi:MAG: DUF2752 domain-containing protein [Candidatus Aureabacteria bacterium]|nr:DUF2752 domain-containing protein [Candidatus Auribacterota bacterium]